MPPDIRGRVPAFQSRTVRWRGWAGLAETEPSSQYCGLWPLHRKIGEEEHLTLVGDCQGRLPRGSHTWGCNGGQGQEEGAGRVFQMAESAGAGGQWWEESTVQLTSLTEFCFAGV